MGEGTIFHWASITKTFTGVALMQLVERGLVSLDDPVAKYVPEIRAVHDPFGDTSEITIRQLMEPLGGLSRRDLALGRRQGLASPRAAALGAARGHVSLHRDPVPAGQPLRYSNPGILFLGQVIERLTTDDYEVYVDKNLLKPLGMHRSYFDVTPYHLQKDKARGYYFRRGRLTPARAETNTGITVSNGGLNAPLEDMARYLAFLVGSRTRSTTAS